MLVNVAWCHNQNFYPNDNLCFFLIEQQQIYLLQARWIAVICGDAAPPAQQYYNLYQCSILNGTGWNAPEAVSKMARLLGMEPGARMLRLWRHLKTWASCSLCAPQRLRLRPPPRAQHAGGTGRRNCNRCHHRCWNWGLPRRRPRVRAWTAPLRFLLHPQPTCRAGFPQR